MGDKENSPFFDEYLPRIYERRRERGSTRSSATCAAWWSRSRHGDGIPYLAELAAMGPYRFVDARAHRHPQGVLPAVAPEFPRLIVLEPLTAPYEDGMTRWNQLYPLSARKPNARYIGEIYAADSVAAVREALEPQNIRFVYDGDSPNVCTAAST